MNVVQIRSAIASYISSLLSPMSTTLADPDIALSVVVECISPIAELERQDPKYRIDVFVLTRLPILATRKEFEVQRVYRIVVRRNESGIETTANRNVRADRFLIFTDELAKKFIGYGDSNLGGVLSIEEGDSTAREVLESEHCHISLIDLQVLSSA